MPDVQRALPVTSSPVGVPPVRSIAQAVPATPAPVQVAQTEAPADSAGVRTPQGRALPTLTLDDTPPAWSASTKAQIRRGFQQGLQQNGITPQELNQVLRQFGISSMEVNEANIQDPALSDEVKRIQTEIGKRLNHPELRALGQAHTVGNDGQFGKNTVQALAALRDSMRGQPIDLNITPIKQQTGTGCYRTAEAMMFNAIHRKDGKPDAYTEFDTRERIKDQDMTKSDIVATKSENAAGRVTVNRDRAMLALDTIDEELEAGRPAIAGVSYRKQDGVEYNEGVTDHFVLITGRGQDEAGTFYTFNDPAQGGQKKLRLDPMTGRLSGKGDMVGTYDVTLVQKATATDTATVEAYARMGKVMYSQGQSSSAIAGMQTMLTQLGYDTKGATGAYGNGTANAVKAFQQAQDLPAKGSQVDTNTLSRIETRFREHQAAHPNVEIFRKGQSSAMLKPVQVVLTRLGYSTNGTTGSFGNGTERAIKAFQLAQGLPDTGKLDNQTWLKILEASK